jgi:hypothetical protein
MIEKHFRNLREIDGIEAFALLDNDSRIISTWTNSQYDSPIFSEIGESYLQIFGIEENLNFDVDEIIIQFDRGLLFVRNHPKFLLLIIANSAVDTSYVRLAANVSIFDLEQSRKTQRALNRMPSGKPSRFEDMKLDDVEYFMINKIVGTGNAFGSSD